MVRNIRLAFVSRPLVIVTAIIALGVLWGGSSTTRKVDAANPKTDTLAPVVGNSVSWVGTKTATPPAGNGESTCTASDENTATGDDNASNCDLFTLVLPAPGAGQTWAGKRIDIRFTWGDATTGESEDYDMVVRLEENGMAGMQGDGANCQTSTCPEADPVLGTSGNGATNATFKFEQVITAPPASGGTIYVRAVYFAVANPLDQYHGTATVTSVNGTPPPVGTAPIPTFDNYQPPATLNGAAYPRRDDSGEPTIGVNWNTGNVLTMSRLQCNRTSFDDSTSPADPNTTKWFPQVVKSDVVGLDPMLWTDSTTGRTICGELQAAAGAQNGVVTDDDLTTAAPHLDTGVTNGQDHQTMGSGPAKPGVSPPAGVVQTYPHLYYYASQAIATATVATSYDGGLHYQPAVPAYNFRQCGGIHGHIKVAPNGTVYLPNKACGGRVGLAVSVDNGQNWTVRTIPTSTSGGSDPSVGIGSGGRLYVGYQDSANHMHVAVSDDEGVTWHDDYDLSLGLTPNLTAAVFAQAVAGDNDRAAVLFLGTNSTNSGDPVGTDNGGVGPNFHGTWYPYIATTADGGKSWNITRADHDPLNPTANNPVQQGVICLNGTLCPPLPGQTGNDTRNLLDFNEITVDARGRILAVYADGCNFDNQCISIADNDPVLADRDHNGGTARLTIIRQRGGMRLFKAFDAGSPTAPSTPFTEVTAAPAGATLLWGTPDDGGAPIQQYRVYRKSAAGAEKLVVALPPNQNTYVDMNGRPGDAYSVTAVNKYGESRKAKPAALKPKQKQKVRRNRSR